MSWSISAVGKPEALKRKIDAEVQNYTGQSRVEFEEVAPHLKALLDAADGESAVSLIASGHYTLTNGAKTYAYVSVKLEQLGKLVE